MHYDRSNFQKKKLTTKIHFFELFFMFLSSMWFLLYIFPLTCLKKLFAAPIGEEAFAAAAAAAATKTQQLQ